MTTTTKRVPLVKGAFYACRVGHVNRVQVEHINPETGECSVRYIDAVLTRGDQARGILHADSIMENRNYLGTVDEAHCQAHREHEEKFPSTRFTPDEAREIRQVLNGMRFMGMLGSPFGGMENVSDLLAHLRGMSERLVWLSEENDRKDATLSEHAYAIEGARSFARLIGLPLEPMQ